MAFDPACVHTDEKVSKGSTRELEDRKEFYPDEAEAHPRNNLEPLGGPVAVRIYIATNHEENL